MTPVETYMTIDAAIWKIEREQRLAAWEVWHTAALMRAKKMPALQALMKQPEAKPLNEDEALKRRDEFDSMRNKWAAIRPR